jgi:putative ABC transport system permease protein
MSWIDRAWNIVGRRDLNHEIDEELQFHIDEKTQENIDSGMSPDEAKRDALRRFGSRAGIREETRDANVLVTTESVFRDIALAVRNLHKQRAFALTAILTLALGIGATTSIFTVVYNVLLRPLPFPDSDRVMALAYHPNDSGPLVHPGVVDEHYAALREADLGFEMTATFGSSPATLTGAGDPVRLSATAVTPDFFRVLRVNAALGRVFVPAEAESETSDPVVVLGHDIWTSRFGADPGIVGRRVMLDGVSHSVVGVMPKGFVYPDESAVWRPLVFQLNPRLSYMRPVIARLRAGTTLAQAQAAWATYASTLKPTPGTRREWVSQVIPLKEAIVGNVRSALWIFAGAVALVLFIACANVSNLLLMRTLARRQEIATRLSLGAARGRVVRQLLTETSVLALLGGAAGTLVTLMSVPALLALVPEGRLPRNHEIHIDGWVLAFTFGVALVSGVVLGVMPALHGTRAAASTQLRENNRATGRSDWLRNSLVVGEVALALVLLVGAGLLIKSFLRLNSVDLGFQPSHVMTMTVNFPESAYPTPASLQEAQRRVIETVSSLPDVAAAGAVNWLPMGNAQIIGDVYLSEGRQVPDRYRPTKAGVSAGYFSAMGIPIVRGRDFSNDDRAAAPGVLIVSDLVARQLWPGEDAIGKRIAMSEQPAAADWLTVVGVVRDVRQTGLKDELAPAVYQPFSQLKSMFFLSQVSFVARTNGDPRPLAAAMRSTLGTIDPNLAPQSMGSMQSLIATTIAEPQFQTRLLVTFSALALLLAAIGVYGVLAASVAERRREIGIRMALGARRATVVRTILRRVVILTSVGVALGFAGALALTRVLADMLFEITPTDATAFFGAGTLLVAIALMAGLVPARRASTIDPISVLRAE